MIADIGFPEKALAIAIESCRLILIQILLQGMGMDPLTSLYCPFHRPSLHLLELRLNRCSPDFAPVCLVFNSMILLPVEGLQPFTDAVHLVGLPTLFLNACLTFALNLSSVAVIGSCSGLVLTLAGVVKDVRRLLLVAILFERETALTVVLVPQILLIAGSWAILGSTITGVQMFGYFIALSGLVAFKLSG